jgi:predicted PurR-regulated permease PerM
VLVCQLVDSFVVRRRVAGHSVHVGLLVPWVVALVGYAVYGVGGAAYGLAFAVFTLALLDELGRPANAPRAPGDDQADGDGAARPVPSGAHVA